jgi:hypothetical protein
MHISLEIPIYYRYFGHSVDPYFTRGPYTADVLVTPGFHISLGLPILPMFGGLRGCKFDLGSL